MDCPPGRPFAAASRSSHGLDGVNFFVAAVQTGFGSFATVYLVKNQWPPDSIGFALTIFGEKKWRLQYWPADP